MLDAAGLPGRDVASAVGRGALAKCPNCGKGGIFSGFLTVKDRCDSCGEELHHHRADDAPAYLTILVVGHVVLPLVLGVEEIFAPAIWIHLLLWGPLIPALTLAVLRPVKGMVVALQWATRMHGFGGADARADA